MFERFTAVLLAATAFAAVVVATAGASAGLTAGVVATPIATCNGSGVATLTVTDASADANLAYQVVAAPGFAIVPLFASDGAFTASPGGFLWSLPSFAGGSVTVTYQVLHTALLDGAQPFQFAQLSWADTDGTHAQSLGGATVTVTGCNKAPVAKAGPNQTVTLSGSPTVGVLLNGSTSTDDGQPSPLTYAWIEGTTTIATGPTPTVQLPVGQHTIKLTVFDGQYSSSASLVVTVKDVSPPAIAPVVTGTLGTNGWYVSDVTVEWSVTDPESPFTKSAGCATATLTTDTTGKTYSCSATSAGGTSSATVVVKRDTTAPLITFVGSAGPFGVDQTVAISCNVSDATSGLASSSCPSASGAAYTFGLGPHTLFATATDAAGNVATRSLTFTVSVSYASLCKLSTLLAGSSVGKQLCSELTEAQKEELNGNLAHKAEEIAEFQVIATKSVPKYLTAARAAILIDLSNQL